MEVNEIKITDIKPSKYNPRKISNDEYNKLSRSIDEFGIVDPIIINLKNKHIIGGHQRYEVLLDEYTANKSKYEKLQVIELGDIGWVFPTTELEIKDLEHEKALNIALNKIQGEWDTTKLEFLFHDLSVDGMDLSLTGFDKLEIKNLFRDVDVNNQKLVVPDNDDYYEDLLNESLENDTSTSSSSSSSGGSSSSSSTGSNKLYPKVRICPKCHHEFYDD